MRFLTAALSGTMLVLAAGGPLQAQTPAAACRGKQQPRLIAELMFGRNIGGHVGVSDSAWMRFLAREVTPRFPDGLTVSDAVGQWRDPSRARIVREPSKRMEIVLPGKDDDQNRLAAIVNAYKSRFRQQSVLVIVRSGCVSF